MAAIDTDGNGTLNFEEFDVWWQVNGGKAIQKPSGVITLADGELAMRSSHLFSSHSLFTATLQSRLPSPHTLVAACLRTTIHASPPNISGPPPRLTLPDRPPTWWLPPPPSPCAKTRTTFQCCHFNHLAFRPGRNPSYVVGRATGARSWADWRELWRQWWL